MFEKITGMFSKKKDKNIINKEIPGTVLWILDSGAPLIKTFRRINNNDGTSSLKFNDGSILKVKSKYIRENKIIIYKTNKGKKICHDPNWWGKMDLKVQNIKELRFNLQNFGLQESKSANHRWLLPLKTLDKLIPLFKLMFICIAIGVIGWSAFKMGTYFLDKVISSRLTDCASIIKHFSTPIGVNITAPI